ncbi:MAG: ATPase [Hyphomonadaceae bacterium]|nr:ATPase [Hyphomonadaceae bacterium]
MTDEAPTLPRRFYKKATLAARDEGFGVALDTRTLRTPGGAVFVAPTQALAALCAGEWEVQGEFIVPATMPICQLAFATLDWTIKNRDQSADYVAKFGETDLCCHRAEAPVELAGRQAERWDRIVTWAKQELSVELPVVTGIIAAKVDARAIAKIRDHAARLDDFRLTALSQASGLAGSALIGFGVVHNFLNASEAFEAAALDNLWSIEHWGEDGEARARLDRQRREFQDITRYLEALH